MRLVAGRSPPPLPLGCSHGWRLCTLTRMSHLRITVTLRCHDRSNLSNRCITGGFERALIPSMHLAYVDGRAPKVTPNLHFSMEVGLRADSNSMPILSHEQLRKLQQTFVRTRSIHLSAFETHHESASGTLVSDALLFRSSVRSGLASLWRRWMRGSRSLRHL